MDLLLPGLHTNHSRDRAPPAQDIAPSSPLPGTGPRCCFHRADRENTTGSWARITSLEFKNWDSGCEGGQESGWEQSSDPQLPSSSPRRGALLQACTPEDSWGWIHRGCTTRNSLQSNTALEPPFSPAPHGPPPTHPQAPSEEANWTQCTPPAPLFIRGAVGEGLISAVARAAAREDLQRETLLKRPAGSISVLPFVLHLSLSIFPEGQEQGTRIQWTCCSIKTPAASCYHLCYLLQTILSPTRAGKRGCQGTGLPGEWNHPMPRKVTPPWTSAQLRAQKHPLLHPHPKSCPNLSKSVVAPELKAGAACSHTEKGAKASGTRELKELPMQGINSLCSTGQVVLGRGPHLFYTPKENIPVFARLSWVGKAYRAPGVIRNTRGRGQGWGCSSAMGDPSHACPKLSPA